MKKLLLSLATLFLFGVITNSAMAQATASATATATMITPIAISNNTDMNFGNIAVQNGTGGTVVLATNSSRTKTGGVTLPSFDVGTVTAASFSITGEGAYTYAITLPGSCTITNTTGVGGETMTVNTFTSNPSGTGALTAGAQTLLVGATLNVSAAQVPGVYVSGTPFDVTVNYN